MMVSKLAIRPISPFLQRPGSQIFSVIGGHDTKLIVSSTFRAEVYVSKNEMPSRFEKMMQGAFHFSNCLLHTSLPPCLVFPVLLGRYPPSFMAKKEIQIGAGLYITRLSFWLRASWNWTCSWPWEWGALIPVKPVAEGGFTVHTYVCYTLPMKCV